MKKMLGVLALGLTFGLCVHAADTPQADLFVGYSFVRYNSAQEVPAFTANGGISTFAWNFNGFLGLEAELGGYHNGNINNHEFDTTTFSYLFGPRGSFNRGGTLVPYVHSLFGGQNAHTSICCVYPTTGVGQPASPGSRVAYDQNNFAMAVGGGLDIKLHKHIMLRPIQLDYLLTRFQAPTFNPNLIPPLTGESRNRNQNNLRYAAGVAFNFGGAQ